MTPSRTRPARTTEDHAVPDREPRDYDNDRLYTSPTARRKMKEAFKGQNGLDRLFHRLEGLARGGP